ncbi:hypothetical protein C8R43DRAFT_951434 [Mycena crocata]|nr:hypothetical protein C8R43DRAFT_951434 [Mycena crocata]
MPKDKRTKSRKAVSTAPQDILMLPVTPDWWSTLRNVPGILRIFELVRPGVSQSTPRQQLRAFFTPSVWDQLAANAAHFEPFNHRSDFPPELCFLHSNFRKITEFLDPRGEIENAANSWWDVFHEGYPPPLALLFRRAFQGLRRLRRAFQRLRRLLFQHPPRPASPPSGHFEEARLYLQRRMASMPSISAEELAARQAAEAKDKQKMCQHLLNLTGRSTAVPGPSQPVDNKRKRTPLEESDQHTSGTQGAEYQVAAIRVLLNLAAVSEMAYTAGPSISIQWVQYLQRWKHSAHTVVLPAMEVYIGSDAIRYPSIDNEELVQPTLFSPVWWPGGLIRESKNGTGRRLQLNRLLGCVKGASNCSPLMHTLHSGFYRTDFLTPLNPARGACIIAHRCLKRGQPRKRRPGLFNYFGDRRISTYSVLSPPDNVPQPPSPHDVIRIAAPDTQCLAIAAGGHLTQPTEGGEGLGTRSRGCGISRFCLAVNIGLVVA